LHSAVGRLPERKTHQSWPPILLETTVDNTITETKKKQIDKGTDRHRQIDCCTVRTTHLNVII